MLKVSAGVNGIKYSKCVDCCNPYSYTEKMNWAFMSITGYW